MALFPSNTLHTVSATGAYRLPAKSRVFANIALGTARQNQPIVPHTINASIPNIPLERQTAEAEIRTIASTLQFTSRPTRRVAFAAKYRLHDLDNQTPHFPRAGSVRFDGVADLVADEGPEFHSIKRQYFDADATFSVAPYTSLKVGYGRLHADRTWRHFETTAEDTLRASIDTTGNQYVTFRAIVERSVRNGDLFDQHVLDEVGEQPGMRQYDIADRDRTRVTTLVTLTPVSQFALNASLAAGKDDYTDDGEFGLRDNDHKVFTFGVDVMPSEKVGAYASYGFEDYDALQASRNSSPGVQFTDPTRNWGTDSSDRVHTFDVGFDLLRLIPRSEVRTSYGYSRARSVYLYTVPANSTLVAPQQLPPIQNLLRNATVDTRFFITRQLALGFVYLYESYSVQDFALGGGVEESIAFPIVQPGFPVVPTTTILLDYLYRPYKAHSGWLRLSYYW
jgi:MtrB/PioB family decaheme-associated outer membrane protein